MSNDPETAFYAIPASSITFDAKPSIEHNKGGHKLITKALRGSTKKKHLFRVDSVDSMSLNNSKIHHSFSKEKIPLMTECTPKLKPFPIQARSLSTTKGVN